MTYVNVRCIRSCLGVLRDFEELNLIIYPYRVVSVRDD